MKNKGLVINSIRALVSLVGFGIFTIYALPLAAGILNIGNIFGMGVGALLFTFGVWLLPIVHFASDLWDKKCFKALFIALCLLCVLFLSLFGLTINSVISSAKYTANGEATVIVLGCKVRGETPSAMLYWRCEAAADYLKANPDAVAILSGGKGNGENISEAECMHRIMIKQGIDESRLYTEDASTSTSENMLFSKRIIDDNNLSSDIAIATSDYHQKRASVIAKRNGLNPSSIPAHGDSFSRATFYTREVFGLWLLYLKG